MKRIKSLGDLTLDSANANAGTERGRAMLDASLREVGAGRSIVVDREGIVIAGNKTVEAAMELGLGFVVVPSDGNSLVVVQREDMDLSEPNGSARRYAYLDNRAGEVGLAWDVSRIMQDVERGVSLEGLWSAAEFTAMVGDAVMENDNEPEATGYILEVLCKSEEECERLGDRLSAEGYACRTR